MYNLLADLNSSSIWNNKYSIAKQIAVTQIIIQTDKNNDEMLNICLIEWVLWWTIEFFVLIFGVGKLSRCDKIKHTLTLKVELFSNNRRQDIKWMFWRKVVYFGKCEYQQWKNGRCWIDRSRDLKINTIIIILSLQTHTFGNSQTTKIELFSYWK